MNANASQPGVVLVDKSLNLVAANLDAVKILAFPERPETLGNVSDWLTKKIHSCLIDRQASTRPSFVSEFRSAQRTYLCRALPLHSGANGPARRATVSPRSRQARKG